MKKGILYGIGAYFLWGILPIYWKMIPDVPALQITSHRVIWSFVFILLVVAIKKRWRGFKPVFEDKKKLLVYCLTAILLATNWLTFIFAVTAGRIVDASLGYFINPLVSVMLGVIFLRERLRLWQWIPVGLAFIGVLYLTISYGRLPWIGLLLAGSFGFYGLLKKSVSLESLHSFTLESGLLFFPALGYLLYLETAGQGAFGHGPVHVTVLLALGGVITGVPLLWFGNAARLIHLSTLGFLQYVAPTLQFLVGVLIYGEDFSPERVIGFSIIWVALLIYSLEGVLHRRKERIEPDRVPEPAPEKRP